MALQIRDQGANNIVKGGPFEFKESLPLIIEGNHNTISIEPGLRVEELWERRCHIVTRPMSLAKRSTFER